MSKSTFDRWWNNNGCHIFHEEDKAYLKGFALYYLNWVYRQTLIEGWTIRGRIRAEIRKVEAEK